MPEFGFDEEKFCVCVNVYLRYYIKCSMVEFRNGENIDETITQNQISNVNSRTSASA